MSNVVVFGHIQAASCEGTKVKRAHPPLKHFSRADLPGNPTVRNRCLQRKCIYRYISKYKRFSSTFSFCIPNPIIISKGCEVEQIQDQAQKVCLTTPKKVKMGLRGGNCTYYVGCIIYRHNGKTYWINKRGQYTR